MAGLPQASLYSRILVAVDFSNCSRSALRYAAELATQFKAQLTVLHVVHETPDSMGQYRRGGASSWLLPMEKVAASMLEEFIAEAYPQEPGPDALQTAKRLIVSGLPGNRIVEAATQENASLVIMSSHCRSGLDRLLHGSVAEKVAKHCQIPVTLVKQQGEPLTAYPPLSA